MRMHAELPKSAGHFDVGHTVHELIAYCDALQAMADNAAADDRPLEHLTAFGFRMLIQPVSSELRRLLQHMETAPDQPGI
jgi:hypothetical protein